MGPLLWEGRVLFPIAVPFCHVEVVDWVCPFVAKLCGSSLYSGKTVSNVLFSVKLWILCISSSSSSRGKPVSPVETHIFWSDRSCWWIRRRRSSPGVRITSPSVGNLGSVVFRTSPLRMWGDNVGRGPSQAMCAVRVIR